MKNLTQEEFKHKYDLIHNDKFIEPITEYVNMDNRIGYICHICGNVFGSMASNYKQKHLCPVCCRYLMCGKLKKETTETYEEKAKIKRDEEYLNIFAINYKKSTDYVYAYCNICGNLFKNRADQILNKFPGCRICGKNAKRINDDIARWNLRLIYGYDTKLDFSHLNYTNGFVTIGCPKHGDYTQRYYWAKLGNGCPFCSIEEESRQAKMVGEYLEKNSYLIKREHTFDDCRDTNLLPFDYYLPIYNAVIEYNGSQHYMPKSFGSHDLEKVLKNFKETQKHDKMKKEYCENNGIKFFVISYKDDTIKKVKEILKELESENIKKKCK